MPQETGSVPQTAAKGPVQPTVDVRGLQPQEARARAFQSFFKVKPGQRAVIHANSPEVVREITNWIRETGHRLLRQSPNEENGSQFTTFELIKFEARR